MKFINMVKLLLRYPSVLLLSLFSPFTVACIHQNGEKYLTVSKKLTMTNLALSFCGTFVGRAFYDFVYVPILKYKTIGYGKVVQSYGVPSYLLTLNICLPLFIIATVCIGLLLFKAQGGHVQKTALNINDFDDIIELDSDKDEEVLVVQKRSIGTQTLSMGQKRSIGTQALSDVSCDLKQK